MSPLSRAPVSEQTISTATGLVKPRIEVCLVDYTSTAAVTDLELDSEWIKGHSVTTFVDVDGNAGTNNITIKDTANVVQAVIDDNYGTVTLYSDGTDIYVQATTSTSFPTIDVGTGTFDLIESDLVEVDHIAEKTPGHGVVFDDDVDMNGGTADGMTSPVSGLFVPAGAILPFGGTAAPSGYLMCDGSSKLRADYPVLYTAIGNAYGTADATHFNLPDLRGKFPRGVDHAQGRDPDRAARTAQATGGNTGDNVGSVQVGATKLPVTAFTTSDPGNHHHHIANSCIGSARAIGTGAYTGRETAVDYQTATDGGAHTHTFAGGDNETRPINVYVEWIIKT